MYYDMKMTQPTPWDRKVMKYVMGTQHNSNWNSSKEEILNSTYKRWPPQILSALQDERLQQVDLQNERLRHAHIMKLEHITYIGRQFLVFLFKSEGFNYQNCTEQSIKAILERFDKKILNKYIKNNPGHKHPINSSLIFFKVDLQEGFMFCVALICPFNPEWNTSKILGVIEQHDLGNHINNMVNFSKTIVAENFEKAVSEIGKHLDRLYELHNKHVQQVVQSRLSEYFPGAAIDVFGGSKHGLITPTSDIDLIIKVPDYDSTTPGANCMYLMDRLHEKNIPAEFVNGAIPVVHVVFEIDLENDEMNKCFTQINTLAEQINIKSKDKYPSLTIQVKVDVTFAPNPVGKLNTDLFELQMDFCGRKNDMRALLWVFKMLLKQVTEGKITTRGHTYFSSFAWRLMIIEVMLKLGIFSDLRARALLELPPQMEGVINTVYLKEQPGDWTPNMDISLYDTFMEIIRRFSGYIFTEKPSEPPFIQILSPDTATAHAAHAVMLECAHQQRFTAKDDGVCSNKVILVQPTVPMSLVQEIIKNSDGHLDLSNVDRYTVLPPITSLIYNINKNDEREKTVVLHGFMFGASFTDTLRKKALPKNWKLVQIIMKNDCIMPTTPLSKFEHVQQLTPPQATHLCRSTGVMLRNKQIYQTFTHENVVDLRKCLNDAASCMRRTVEIASLGTVDTRAIDFETHFESNISNSFSTELATVMKGNTHHKVNITQSLPGVLAQMEDDGRRDIIFDF